MAPVGSKDGSVVAHPAMPAETTRPSIPAISERIADLLSTLRSRGARPLPASAGVVRPWRLRPPDVQELGAGGGETGELGHGGEGAGVALGARVARRPILARAVVDDDAGLGQAGGPAGHLERVGHVADLIDQTMRQGLVGGGDAAGGGRGGR